MGLLDALGGGRRGGMSPMTMALLGLLAYRTMKGKGRLADMLGTGSSAGAGREGSAGGPGGSAAGNPGGTLAGALGGSALGKGLQDLLGRFRQAGQADKVDSWVAKGPNRPIAPQELEQALGEERIQWLMAQTGLSKPDLLAGLSTELPDAVDKLTPEGHVPTDEELERGGSSFGSR